MRFTLYASLQPEFALSRWVQDGHLPGLSPNSGAHEEQQKLTLTQAIESLTSWTSALRAAHAAVAVSDAADGQQYCSCPHKALLFLAQHMQQHASPAPGNSSSAAEAGYSSMAKALTDPLLQLAAAAQLQMHAGVAVEVGLHQQRDVQNPPHCTAAGPAPTLLQALSKYTGSHGSEGQLQQPEAAGLAAENPAPPPTGQLAHATAPAAAAAANDEEQLKVMLFWLCHLTTSFHQFILRTPESASDISSKTKKDKNGGPMLLHQQQKWLQKTLPTILQHLVACYSILAGDLKQAGSSSSSTPDVAEAGQVHVLSRQKDRVGADELLLATCFSIMNTAAAPSTKTPAKSAASNRSSSSNTTPQLPRNCLQLCASMLGAHILFRYSPQQPCIQVVGELCRILQDSQQHNPQQKEVLIRALAGMVTTSRSQKQGMQILCSIAEAVFPPSAATPQRNKQSAAKSRKQQQPQEEGSAAAVVEAAAGAAASSPAALLLLELLVDVMQLLVTTGSNDHQQQQQLSQQVPLLAAVMLPKLLPAAVMHSNPNARKLWLGLASIAAIAAVPVAPGSRGLQVPDAADVRVDARAAAAAAAQAHSTGLSVLAAAAAGDHDANVRSKALGLLADAVSCIRQHLAYWQQQEAQMGQQEAGNVLPPQPDSNLDPHGTSSSSSIHACQLVVQMLQDSLGAVITALNSQLAGSSKSCRIKALQLLQELLCDPEEVAAAAAAAVQPVSATAAAKRAAMTAVKHQQQQLVGKIYPCIVALLDTPQDSPLHCPASKVAVRLLLPQMAAVLQPQQALQLVLSCSSSSNAAGKLLEGVSQCSEQALYEVLRQQLLLQPSADSSAQQQELASAAAAASGTPGASVQTTVSKGLQQQQEEHAQRSLLLSKLQQLLSGGGCCSKPLRRYAFLQVIKTQAAAVAGTDVGDGSAEGASNTVLQQRLQQMYQLQQDLMLSVQLLELSGGCTPQHVNPKDLKGELAILTDTLDLCCYWMQQMQDTAAAAAAAAAGSSGTKNAAAVAVETAEELVAAAVADIMADVVRSATAAGEGEVQDQQQQRQAVSTLDGLVAQFAICEQLMGGILRVMCSAAAAAAGQCGGSSSKGSTKGLPTIAEQGSSAACATGPAAGSFGSSKQHQTVWANTAASLHHHLGFIVSSVAAEPATPTPAAEADARAETARRNEAACQAIHVETLSLYIQVLCAANSSSKMALHELLLVWHKDLLPTPGSSSSSNHSAAAPPRSHTKLVAFLLLLQHLAGFYEVEQQQFKEKLLTTLQQSSGSDPAAAAAGAAGISQPDTDRPSQQHQQETGASGCSSRAAARKRVYAADQRVSNNNNSSSQGGPDQPEPQPDEDSFDYMVGEEARQCVEASTATFMDGLMAETAPACYLPLLLQLLAATGTPEHIKVLALQALQPLLLCSSTLSSQHSILLAALLADPSTPSALQLQAVATASELIAAAPARNQLLVQKLEQLVLQGLAAADSCGGGGSSSSSRCDVLAAAAGVYAVLLLHEKLLLAAVSWSVVAAGLLAPESLQVVSATMQELLHCLTTQQRIPRTKAALGLLMNCPTPAAAAAASSNTTTSSSSSSSRAASTSRAVQLVEQHILGLLTPKDLASDELQLPLLSALGQAAVAGGWGGDTGAAEPAAVLLAACNPSGRCLDTLLGIVQGNKNAISQPCSAETLTQLQAYTAKYRLAAASRPRRAAAVGHDHDDGEEDSAAAVQSAAGAVGTAAGAAAQAKLQLLLSEAAAATAAGGGGRRIVGQKRRPAASAPRKVVPGRLDGFGKHSVACQSPAAAAAAAERELEDDEGTRQEHRMVKQLLAERQQTLQQYRAEQQLARTAV